MLFVKRVGHATAFEGGQRRGQQADGCEPAGGFAKRFVHDADVAAFLSGQLQSARVAIAEFSHEKHDDAEGGASQGLVSCPDRVAIVSRFDDEQAIGGEAEGADGGRVEIAEGVEEEKGTRD